MIPVRRLIGAGIVVFVLAWAVAGAGDLMLFFDPASAIFVVGLIVGGMWMVCGPRACWRAVVTATLGEGDRDAAARAFTLAHQLSWGAGILGMVVSLVAMLKNMDDPSAIGPGMAVAMLPFFYAAVLAELIFNPLRHAVSAPPDESAAPQTSTLAPHRWIATSVLLFAMLTFSVLSASAREVNNEMDWYFLVRDVKRAFADDKSSLSQEQRESVERVEAWRDYSD